MPLSREVESLDVVPEALRGLYKEKDGKFVAEPIEGIHFADEVEGLKASQSRLLKEKKELAAKFAGLDVEELRRLKAEADERESRVAQEKGEYQKLLQKQREQYEGEKAKLTEREKVLLTKLESKLVDSELVRAIVAEGGNPKLLLPAMRGRVRMAEDEGDFRLEILNSKGEPMLGGKGELATAEDLVKEFAADDDYAGAFSAKGETGGGARSQRATPKAAGKNPWKADSFNLTEQMRLTRENPALAEKFKREVGAS